MRATNPDLRPGGSSEAIRRVSLLFLLLLVLSGCGSRAPYFLVESRLLEGQRSDGVPDLTETPTFLALRKRGGIETLALRPPDVCADRGLSGGGGAGELQLGVMRMRCGVEMAELERALVRAGYLVVSWSAVRQRAASQEEPLIEAAAALDVDVLIQVNALERVDILPGRDARWERRFYEATRAGERGAPAAVSPGRARKFEALVGRSEKSLASGERGRGDDQRERRLGRFGRDDLVLRTDPRRSRLGRIERRDPGRL